VRGANRFGNDVRGSQSGKEELRGLLSFFLREKTAWIIFP